MALECSVSEIALLFADARGSVTEPVVPVIGAPTRILFPLSEIKQLP